MSNFPNTPQPADPTVTGPAAPAAPGAPDTPPAQPGKGLPFDPWRLLAALRRRWLLILGTAIVLAGAGGGAGHFAFHTDYKAAAQLIREEAAPSFRASELGEPFKPRQLSVATLVGFMKSPRVLERVAEVAKCTPGTIAGGLTITPERNTDLINLTFATRLGADTAVRILNSFGTEFVRFTAELQSQEAAEINRLLKRQLAKAEEEIRAANTELLDFSKQAGVVNADKEIDAYLHSLGEVDLRFDTMRIEYETVDLKIKALERELAANNPLTERVLTARERLHDYLQIYTEANPIVVEQKETLRELESRLQAAGDQPIAAPRQGEGGLATGFYSELLTLRTQKEVLSVQIEKLKAVRTSLEDKLKGLPEKGMQLARIRVRQQSLESSQALLTSRQREAQLYEENALGYYRYYKAKPDEVDVSPRGKKVVMVAVAGAFFGFALASFFVCLVESLDDRVKTVADLRRVTRLPVLATLPNLAALDAGARSNWAFRTWLAMQSKMKSGPRGEVVCGWLSANPGEGCSTWVELLAGAAAQRSEHVIALINRPPARGEATPLATALADPTHVTGEAGCPRWIVAPPAWRWDAGRRRQWRNALAQWTQNHGTIVLVELNESAEPETLLQAETLPQLIWLSRSGVARGPATQERLQNARNAGCPLAGAVLNEEVKILPWL